MSHLILLAYGELGSEHSHDAVPLVQGELGALLRGHPWKLEPQSSDQQAKALTTYDTTTPLVLEFKE